MGKEPACRKRMRAPARQQPTIQTVAGESSVTVQDYKSRSGASITWLAGPTMYNDGHDANPMRTAVDIFAQISRTLWAHKLRSFLPMFGIAWGVGSLVLLVGLGEGFRSGNKRQFDSLGENVMFIWR